MIYKFVLYFMLDFIYFFKYFLFVKKYYLLYFWFLSLWDKIKKLLFFNIF